MESPTSLCGVSFRKVPRRGQRNAIEAAADPARSTLNVQLPTGYGKTLVANGVYAVLRAAGRVNRMLIIFPTEAQHEQYVASCGSDLRDVSLEGHKVADMRFMSVARVLKAHRTDTNSIFATTIQSLIQPGGFGVVSELLETGQWLIVVDEHHHYGEDKTWGQRVKGLNRQFLLAMSATPYRKDNDNAFGTPDIEITYRDAVKESAVKPLCGHSYYYRLDLIHGDGEIERVTPEELIAKAGGDSPQLIERLTKDMRQSPKYIYPLISEPLQRLTLNRIGHGKNLQAIVGCMFVDHAKTVCKQVQAMFPGLRVDWVGTGSDGRDDNKDVIKKFCPPKENGERPTPELDVLVHVGMAGEGLDTTLVSEIIHLNGATLCNQNNQENGRASRYLEGVLGNINFDSTSGYAPYVGSAMEYAMDLAPPDVEVEEEPVERQARDYAEIPEWPRIGILNVTLDHINSGLANINSESPTVQLAQKLLTTPGDFQHYPVEALLDPDSPVHAIALEWGKNLYRKEALQHDSRALESIWRRKIQEGLNGLVGNVIQRLHNGAAVERTLAGDIMKRLNWSKCKTLGPVNDADGVEGLKEHWAWVYRLDQSIIRDGVPSWLR